VNAEIHAHDVRCTDWCAESDAAWAAG
jgi:hypothetical protein